MTAAAPAAAAIPPSRDMADVLATEALWLDTKVKAELIARLEACKNDPAARQAIKEEVIAKARRMEENYYEQVIEDRYAGHDDGFGDFDDFPQQKKKVDKVQGFDKAALTRLIAEGKVLDRQGGRKNK